MYPEKIERFFKEVADISVLANSSLFVCRADGVNLFHMNGLGQEANEMSVGALLGGVWHAARELVKFIPKQNDEDVFRLSFDTSSQGVYILPIKLVDEEFYLGLIYFDEMNPGFVKSRLRDLAFRLQEFLEKDSEKKAAKKDESVLFENISDDEMDNLFSFASN